MNLFLNSGLNISDEIEILTNKKGGKFIFHNDYKFIKSSENKKMTHFRCTNYTKKCRARITTSFFDGLAFLSNEHNHESDSSIYQSCVSTAVLLERIGKIKDKFRPKHLFKYEYLLGEGIKDEQDDHQE